MGFSRNDAFSVTNLKDVQKKYSGSYRVTSSDITITSAFDNFVKHQNNLNRFNFKNTNKEMATTINAINPELPTTKVVQQFQQTLKERQRQLDNHESVIPVQIAAELAKFKQDLAKAHEALEESLQKLLEDNQVDDSEVRQEILKHAVDQELLDKLNKDLQINIEALKALQERENFRIAYLARAYQTDKEFKKKLDEKNLTENKPTSITLNGDDPLGADFFKEISIEEAPIRLLNEYRSWPLIGKLGERTATVAGQGDNTNISMAIPNSISGFIYHLSSILGFPISKGSYENQLADYQTLLFIAKAKGLSSITVNIDYQTEKDADLLEHGRIVYEAARLAGYEAEKIKIRFNGEKDPKTFNELFKGAANLRKTIDEKADNSKKLRENIVNDLFKKETDRLKNSGKTEQSRLTMEEMRRNSEEESDEEIPLNSTRPRNYS